MKHNWSLADKLLKLDEKNQIKPIEIRDTTCEIEN